MIDQTLRRRLLAMAEHDARVRERLADSGALFDGYHPEMEVVHRANADELHDIVEVAGWPTEARAGADGAEAAWLVAQHAIGLPDFQRRCLASIEAAADAGAVPRWQAAYLDDRIRTYEGRPQRYGTQFDWDEAGQMSPLPIDDIDTVDIRRAEIGLASLAEMTRRHRANSAGNQRPADLARYRASKKAWEEAAGWRPK